MNPTRQTFVLAFALFSLFFGAGNLVLPPFLGYNSGENWPFVALGFSLSAVIIPILAIYGHARLQGTMMDFGTKVSPIFALVYCICVYGISSALPSPRTASFTYEMAVQPYFEMSSLLFSTIYFALVLVFVLNRNRILSLIGKFLTPLIIVILLAVIVLGLFGELQPLNATMQDVSFAGGIIEGYQTFDAIGGVVVGGVIVVSLALQGKFNYKDQRIMIRKAGLIGGIGLFLIYTGLIALGAYQRGNFGGETRTELLNQISLNTLGNMGTAFLAVLVALACFTTAVGIVTGTADFVKGLFGGSNKAYVVTGILGCLLGIWIGQSNVSYIIDVALPALCFIYPITIVLILLNVLPAPWASPLVFRWVIAITFVFSIPDFLGFLINSETLTTLKEVIPLADQTMGWVLPATLTFLIINSIKWLRSERLSVEN